MSGRGPKAKWSKPSKRAARGHHARSNPGSPGASSRRRSSWMTPPTNSPFAVVAVLDEPDRRIAPLCAVSESGPPSAVGRPRRTDALPGSDDPDGGLVHSAYKIGIVRLGGVLTVASFRLCRSSPSTQCRHELWHLSKIRTECDGIFCWRYRHHLRAAVWRLAARPVHRRGPADRWTGSCGSRAARLPAVQ